MVEASISHLCYIAVLYPQTSSSSSSPSSVSTGSDDTVSTGGDSDVGQAEVEATSNTPAESAAPASGESQSQEPGTTSYLTWYIIGGVALVVIIVALGLAWKRARRYG